MKSAAFLTVALITAFSYQTDAQNAKDKTQLPYVASYSSKFQMGNEKYSAIVLNIWKAYDDNSFDNMNTDFIVDTITAIFANGTLTHGKDAFLNAVKSYRSGFSTVKSEVLAYLPVKSTDRKEDILLIWGSENGY